MNQILVTGEERVKEERVKKVNKEKNVLPINGIVTFFSVCIIILGICMICGSVYAKEKINESVEEGTKPQVEINRDDDNSKIEINVKHIRNITKITYKWNDENEKILYGNNQEKSTNVSEKIDLLGGKNTLSVAITEENGQVTRYEKTYTVNIPEIKLESVSNGVKLIATSEVGIDYVRYNWDNGENKEIEANSKNKYEGTIETPQGQHTLEIEVEDVDGKIARMTTNIVGDTEPTLKIKPDYVDGEVAFVIEAEDDEEITKVEIIHNKGEKQIREVNDKKYYETITMTKKEINTLAVTVTNKNGLTKTLKVKFDNK